MDPRDRIAAAVGLGSTLLLAVGLGVRFGFWASLVAAGLVGAAAAVGLGVDERGR